MKETISFSLKNSVARAGEDALCSVLDDCTCSIQAEGKVNEGIFILTLCFAVWITRGSLHPLLEEEAITAVVAPTMKVLVFAEVNSCLAKVKLPSIDFDALTWQWNKLGPV
ncbi:MAG TPA: hypothetical protein VJ869_15010 [Sphaerochaeta sp.]|nr:hypothetical protein [Sphaerochaeta sp.]